MTEFNREEALRTIKQLQQEIRDLTHRLDKLAAQVGGELEVGGLYREQIRARPGDEDRRSGT